MKPISQYSLVIFPTPEQIKWIRSCKQLLKKEIGWFGSVDSAAHCTIIQFANDLELSLYIDGVREFCKDTVPQQVTFNSWDAFGLHTFFLAPDKPSQDYLNTFIIDLHQVLGFRLENAHAHISIARRLNPEKIKKAWEIFKNVEINLKFDCDALYIRKFNGRQYDDIQEKIPFRYYWPSATCACPL